MAGISSIEGARAADTMPEPQDTPISLRIVVHPRPERLAECRQALATMLAAARAAAGCRLAMPVWQSAGPAWAGCAMIRFDGRNAYRLWCRSEAWRRWLDARAGLEDTPAAPEIVGDDDDVELVLPQRRPAPPPRHKMAVVMMVSVYPTITLLLWLLSPLVESYPLPMRTLILSVVMVPLMVWFIVPWVTRRFAGWLAASRGTGRLRPGAAGPG